MLQAVRRSDNIPVGALGKLNTQATGPGTQPFGSQKMGCFLYHHTNPNCAPVVKTQMALLNLTANPVLADVNDVSDRQRSPISSRGESRFL